MLHTHIRVATWAVIVRDTHILLVECLDPNAATPYHFNLPGGGVDPGESLHAATVREVREETTAEVDVGKLLFVWDHPGGGATRPHVRPAFRCTLKPGSEPRMPDHPDEFQIGVKWIPLADLAAVPLLPPISAAIIRALDNPNARDPYLPE